ncbi:MAG: putative sugar nucleotidyl transferase, partial [Gemmatimonadaceae bacterium]
MTRLILFDDARAREFEPFALTRPACELRAGATLVRQRWETALGATAIGFVSAAHLDDFEEPGAPAAFREAEIPAGTVIANARALPSLETLRNIRTETWTIAGKLAAVRLARAKPTAPLREPGAVLE